MLALLMLLICCHLASLQSELLKSVSPISLFCRAASCSFCCRAVGCESSAVRDGSGIWFAHGGEGAGSCCVMLNFPGTPIEKTAPTSTTQSNFMVRSLGYWKPLMLPAHL